MNNADVRTVVLYNALNSGTTLDSVCQVSPKDYPFAAALRSLFEINNLESLHQGENLDVFVNADLGNDSNSRFHKIFYETIKDQESELRKIWDDFLKNCVKSKFAGEEKLIVQKLPNIRIHVPGAQAVKRWHHDSDENHNHPLGEINVIVSLTKMSGNNSVWRESEPGLGDYAPFELDENTMVFWNGNTCNHGNKVNDTNKTRISLDFRVMKKEHYIKEVLNKNYANTSATSSTKFSIGNYYTEI